MRPISSLLRNQGFTAGRITRFRKGLSAQALVKRKQNRRLKRMNTFARDYTSQQIPHNWLNGKRIKQLGITFQTLRNIHPLSTPISPQMKQQIRQKMKEDCDWSYYIQRNQLQQMKQEKLTRQQCNIEEYMEVIPTKLRKQILADREYPLPELADTQFLYNQQIQLICPLDIRHKENLKLRAKIKMETDASKGQLNFQDD